MRKIVALLVAALACVGFTITSAASPAAAVGHIINVAGSGAYQDDIKVDMAMTFDPAYTGGSPNWYHFNSKLSCDEPGLSVSTAAAVSGGGAYEYMGVWSCNGATHTTSLANNTAYSSSRYFRYEFSSPSRGKYCLWIAPRSNPQTDEGPC